MKHTLTGAYHMMMHSAWHQVYRAFRDLYKHLAPSICYYDVCVSVLRFYIKGGVISWIDMKEKQMTMIFLTIAYLPHQAYSWGQKKKKKVRLTMIALREYTYTLTCDLFWDTGPIFFLIN